MTYDDPCPISVRLSKMARKPKYRRHTVRDLGFVEYQGKRLYFPGSYKSAESLRAYRDFLLKNVLVAHFTATPDAATLTVGDLVKMYQAWADRNYQPGPRSEAGNVKAALAHIKESGLLAADYLPTHLKALMERLARSKRRRSYINGTASKIKRMFKWAVSESLIPPAVSYALATVTGLRPDRSPAVESTPRRPVPWEHVEPVVAQLSPTVGAMVLLQWHTGARPQTICQAQANQFDCSRDPWEWRPGRHKTTHLGKSLVIYCGPKAQAILKPHMGSRDYLFQPKHLNGQRAKGYRGFYDATSYRQAVDRAIERVNRDRRAEKLPEIPRWTPHQIRHTKATLVRAAYGLEAAQAVTGHATLSAAQIYAQRSSELAKQVAAESG